MTVHLDASAELVVELLTWHARVCSLDHVQRILLARCPNPPCAQRLIRRLDTSGCVRCDFTAAAFREPLAPLYDWSPGRPQPDWHALAWQLEKSWHGTRPRRITICWATEKAARLCGGIAPFAGHANQVEHDLGTASILARLHEISPATAACWVGEDILRRDYSPRVRWLRKVPDAAIIDNHRLIKVIEFGGQYSAERIRRFHAHCRKHILSYELW